MMYDLKCDKVIKNLHNKSGRLAVFISWQENC